MGALRTAFAPADAPPAMAEAGAAKPPPEPRAYRLGADQLKTWVRCVLTAVLDRPMAQERGLAGKRPLRAAVLRVVASRPLTPAPPVTADDLA